LASYEKCIKQALTEKKITPDVGKRILAASDPQLLIEEMATTATAKKRAAAVDAIRLSQAIEKINAHPDGPYHGLASLLGRDTKGVANTANVDLWSRVYSNRTSAEFADGLSAFRTRMGGLSQDKEGINNFIRGTFGSKSNDSKINKLVSDYEAVRLKQNAIFNSMGGSIPNKIKGWLPQNHDMRRIKNATEDTWVEYVKPMMDRSQMLDDAGKIMDDVQFEETLRYVYQTITTGGINKAQGLTRPRGMGIKLSNKGSEKRVLHFKDADSWLQYNKDYGKGDIFSTITDHFQNMANDTALLQLLGTNPRNMFDNLKFQAEKAAIKNGKPLTGKEKLLLESNYKVASGEINGGELTTMADVGSGVRNIMVGAYYPAALLASFTDIATVSLTAAYNGMNPLAVMGRVAAMDGEEGRLFAAQIGIVTQSWMGRQHSTNRIADTFGVGVDAKIAEATMRFSGLEPWTNRVRKAFGMESSAHIARNFNKQFDDLPISLKEQFQNYGITTDDWNAFRSTKTMDQDGVKFADFTKDKSMKFHAMVLTETDFAVPTPGVRERAVITAGTQRATVEGQALRQIAFAKSHPVTIMMTHWNRGMQEGTMGGKVAYLGALGLATTMMGAVAIHAKDLAKGKEPQEMNGEFWKKALLMGGSIGLLGDYTLSDPGSYGNSPIESVVGPGAQFFNRTFDLTLGNIHEAIAGEEMNVLGDIAKYAKYITPGTWQTDIVFNSMMDQAILSVDPNYQKTINSIRRREQKEVGRGFWFGPGETVGDLFD
jgi:hypothetical protein